MAETMPEMDPASLISEQSAALSARLVKVARNAVKAALEQGAPASVADVMAALEAVAVTLPPGLLAEIEVALPEVARQAVIAAEVEIADARAESGKPFPSITPPPTGDYAGWAVTAVGALVSSLKRRVEPSAQTVATVADAGELSAQVLAELDDDIRAALSALFDTATARAVNESRMEVFHANADVVQKVKVVTVADAKRSEVCTNMNGATFDPKRPVPTPPFHNGCRSYLRAITTAKRKKGATEAEIYRQNWAIYRRLEREAAQAEARADERLELRFAPTADATGTFTGVASAYGVLDAHGTEFAPGSFAVDIAERRAEGRKVPLLLHHDPERPCGVVEEMRETPDGLMIEGRFILDTEAGREAHALAKAGAVALSVGFKRTADRARPGGGRIITEARLAEVSIVAVASNPKAAIIEVRGNSPAAGAASSKEKRAMPDSITAPADTGKDLDARVGALETTVTEIKSAVDEIKAAVTKTEARADRLEARGARLNLGIGDQPAGAIERRAFSSYLRSGDRAPAEELRSLAVSSDPQGGYLAPAEISTEFIRDLVEFSPIRALATVRQISAPSVKYPRRTGVTNAQWEGEGDDQAESNVPFGQVDIPARNLSTFVDISNQLLADSGGTAEAEVRRALAEDFGQKEGLAFVSGGGPLQPEGLLTATGVAYTATGNASTLGSAPADLLITAMYALPAAYRARATWLMNSTTLAAVRKLKDGTTGVYLWQPAYAAGQPETILGRPVIEVPDMDDVGSGTTPILFGDIATAYRIVDRLDMSILVNPYLLATKGVTRIHATRRVGAAVVQPAALRKIKCATS